MSHEARLVERTIHLHMAVTGYGLPYVIAGEMANTVPGCILLHDTDQVDLQCGKLIRTIKFHKVGM